MARKYEPTVAEVLTRGVEQVIVRQTVEERMKKGEKLKVYLGFDPTSSRLHLGNSIPLRKLRDFMLLGHEVIFLVGNFTALIGDTSDKEAMRKPMTLLEIEENLKTYKEQAEKVIDFSRVKMVYNGDWLSKLSFEDVVKLAQQFTVQQMIERDMYQKRLEGGKPIGLHEFLYPLMQGYDSVAMDVDLEVGGNDQTFNMLAGRTLQRVYHQKEKHVLTTSLLEGTDGRKMSKAYGNGIDFTDEPKEMFGKLMSMADELIIPYFTLCTDVPMKQIKEVEAEMKGGANPRDFKVLLAKEIVGMYHSEVSAEQCSREFEEVFSKGGKPEDIEVRQMEAGKFKLAALLEELGMAESRSDAKRLIEQGGVRLNEVKVEDKEAVVELKVGKRVLLQVGKRKWMEVEGEEGEDR